MVDPKSVAVVELTRYPNWYPGSISSIGDTDKIRGDLALESIAKGVAKGYNMVIADGGSSAGFLEKLLKFPAITYIERHDQARASGRRQGFLAASKIDGVNIILRTEPEKVSIVEEYIPYLISPIVKGNANIVIAKRNPILFRDTYPEYMWRSETMGNKSYNALLQKYGLLTDKTTIDIFFGPVSFQNNPQILQLFLEKYEFTSKNFSVKSKYVDPEEWSNGFLFPIVKALYEGMKVVSEEVDFKYPRGQKTNEETKDKDSINRFISKRMEQRLAFLEELTHFVKYLHNDPSSGLRKVE